jgi:hypothetical protein
MGAGVAFFSHAMARRSNNSGVIAHGHGRAPQIISSICGWEKREPCSGSAISRGPPMTQECE